MDVSTKYDIGDEVFFMSNNMVARQTVTGVAISIANAGDEAKITYHLHYGDTRVEENKLFKTKKELLESL